MAGTYLYLACLFLVTQVQPRLGFGLACIECIACLVWSCLKWNLRPGRLKYYISKRSARSCSLGTGAKVQGTGLSEHLALREGFHANEVMLHNLHLCSYCYGNVAAKLQ